MFSVTGVLVTLLAAGLAASAVQQLSNAGVLNVLDTSLWDTSWLLSETSWPGRILHVLIGYMDRPTGMQLIAYVATAATIFGLAYTRRAPAAQRQGRAHRSAPVMAIRARGPIAQDDPTAGRPAASGIFVSPSEIREIVDAGIAQPHQAVGIELPVLVAVGAEPLAAVVAPLVGEADGDAVVGKRPKLLDQPVVELARPLAGQEVDDLCPSNREIRRDCASGCPRYRRARRAPDRACSRRLPPCGLSGSPSRA